MTFKVKESHKSSHKKEYHKIVPYYAFLYFVTCHNLLKLNFEI